MKIETDLIGKLVQLVLDNDTIQTGRVMSVDADYYYISSKKNKYLISKNRVRKIKILGGGDEAL